jgi:hypothetical protein
MQNAQKSPPWKSPGMAKSKKFFQKAAQTLPQAAKKGYNSSVWKNRVVLE